MPAKPLYKVAVGIPTYAANGARLRDYSESAIARLLTLDLIVVERARRGKRQGQIVCAHFRPVGGANPLRRSAHTGTRYSYEQALPSGHFAWKHRRLLQSQELEELLGEPLENEHQRDLYLRAIFRAVPLSVMKKPSAISHQVLKQTSFAHQPSAKVVSIEAGRRKPVLQNAVPERIAA